MPVKAKKGDITKLQDIDVIVNAANGIGVMGAGVAGAIRRVAGEGFKIHVREIALGKEGGYKAGEVYVTDVGLLYKQGIKAVLHAVTMQYPGGSTSYGVVDQCLHTVFRYCQNLGHKTIAVPGLGTGIGNLNPLVVARSTVKIAQKWSDRLDILITDIDEAFIAEANKALLE